MTLTLAVAAHPLVDIGAFVMRLPTRLDATMTPAGITALMAAVATPFRVDDALRGDVRALLRAGGFKPSGRSKPASEYLVTALAEGRFPRINAAVDACNVASLHTGLPISLVDVDLIVPRAATNGATLEVRCAPPATSYVFNPSGQVIDGSGLLCVFDANGPTGTPVKDAQRTKTHEGTRAAIAIVWGTRARPGLAAAATRWYRELVAMIPGATTDDVVVNVG